MRCLATTSTRSRRSGLGFATLALALLYAFTRRLLTPYVPRERAIRVAQLVLVFAIASPLVLRLSVSDTFWPYAMCLVFGAGLAGVTARDDGRLDSVVVASTLLGLAALTSHAMLGLLGLALVAPLSFGIRRLRPDRVAATVLTLAVVAGEDALSVLRSPVAVSVLSGDRGSTTLQLLAFHPSFASIATIVLAMLGLHVAYRARAVHLLPVAYALVVTWYPAARLNTWQELHPSRLMFTYSEVLFASLLPALGLDHVAALALARRDARVARAFVGGALTALLVTTPLAYEGTAFLFELDTVARELFAIERMIPALPDADVLVYPDTVQDTRRDLPMRSDPVEIVFPAERALAQLARTRRTPPRLVRASSFLARPEAFASERVVIYVGLSWHTFVQGEIAAGVVPETLERDQLRAIRETGTLRPVEVTTLTIHDHPARTMRVMADRRSSIDVGFYEWTSRDHAR